MLNLFVEGEKEGESRGGRKEEWVDGWVVALGIKGRIWKEKKKIFDI